ncbi:MAG: phytanoyl-CoA dioxygenase family protein [Chromatiales bacterium]|jgi:hypothetical protein|nr:phytanoyl-CoA dioxygenase family protein [Chromatiales bacterium]
MLTDAQIAQYHADGYVIPDYRISDEVLEDIRTAHTRLVERFPQFSDYCPAILPFDMGFLRFAQNDALLDMVGQVIGEDIALWNSSFFAKPARTGSRTPWHQDGEYWPMRPLATCTVWIAVDDATPENGCLQVIRGSHKGKRLRRHTTNNGPGLALNQELVAEEYNEADAVELVLEAGQVSLHDVYLAHGSEPNHSDQPRRGMTLRYMPTTSRYDREIETALYAKSGRNNNPPRPVFLMRGVDQSGGTDFAQMPNGSNG